MTERENDHPETIASDNTTPQQTGLLASDPPQATTEPEPLEPEHLEAIESARAHSLEADALCLQGQLDKALAIRQKKLLPTFERIGDLRLRSIAYGKVADIYMLRGQHERALFIRQEELRVYQEAGDIRSVAITQEQIADIHCARGALDRALDIYTEAVLPVLETLDDPREQAIALGKIATVHQLQGDFQHALEIRQQQQLPLLEQAGDNYAIAIAQGKLADLLHLTGQFEESLTLRRNQELPAYQAANDIRSQLVCRTNIALSLLRMDEDNHVVEVVEMLEAALQTAQRLELPEAEQIEELMERFGI